MGPYTFSEVSLTMASLTSGKNYDVFAYINSGAVTFDLGPAWTGDTTRGAGAGTTQLATVDGVLVNAVQITGVRRGHTIAANQGVYVGTIRTTGTTNTEDSAQKRFRYNWYNQVPRRATFTNATSHTYATAAWQYVNNDSTAFFQAVCGQDNLCVVGIKGSAKNSASGRSCLGVGIDTTGGANVSVFSENSGACIVEGTGPYAFGLGCHLFNLIESCSSGLGTYSDVIGYAQLMN